MNIIFKILDYLKKRSNLIKNIIIALCIVAIVVLAGYTVDYYNRYNKQTDVISSAEADVAAAKDDVAAVEADNDALNQQIKEYEDKITEQQTEIDGLKKQLEEAKEQVRVAQQSKPVALAKKYVPDGNYTQATQVWNHLKGLGLNDYVCAGILGNIMAEVGGQTLDISRWSYYSSNSSTYYGICQWAGGRKSRLLNNFGTSLEAQLEFLSVELFEVIPKGNAFYSMQNEQEAALYFAKYYERCSSKYYSVRQRNATKALSYFRSV